MHRADILASIKKTGTTITQLSIDAGLSPGAGSKALKVPFPAAEEAIAARVNLPLHVLWPTRYTPTGRIHNSERKPYSTRPPTSKAA